MYEAMEICSRTLQFFLLSFSCYMFVSATRSLISAHDAPSDDLQTPDSGMYVGAVSPLSIPPRS